MSNRDYYSGMTEGRMQERERIIKLLEKRRDDLLGCHKNDDCHIRAAVRLLTGFTDDEIDELGGFEEEKK